MNRLRLLIAILQLGAWGARLPRPRRWSRRLLTTRGGLDIILCALCGALVVADGARQHERHDHAQTGGGER